MENLFLFLFFTLITSVPFLYRFIRIGEIGWFVNRRSNSKIDKKYKDAEKLRIFQVVLGAIFFVIHGAVCLGLYNILTFLAITFIVSLILEIIGSKKGYIFGGKYHYNKENTPGYLIFGVPILIPVAWFGIIYMCSNFCIYLTEINFPFETLPNYYFILLTAVFVMFLDLVLDPLAVDEKRWSWEYPGIYYGVPFLNFIGWLMVPISVLLIFHQFSKELDSYIHSFSALFHYSPSILFIALPIIASRPCFERGLRIPGYFGVITSLAYLLIGIGKYCK